MSKDVPGKERSLPRRGQVGVIVAPAIVLLGTFDRVVAVRVIARREAPRDRLDVIGLGSARKSVGLPRFAPRFEACDVLDSRKRQQVSQLGGVEYVRRLHRLLGARLRVQQGDRPHSISMGLAGDRLAVQPQVQQPLRPRGVHHLFEDRQPDARLMAQPRYEAVAWVQVGVGAGRVR